MFDFPAYVEKLRKIKQARVLSGESLSREMGVANTTVHRLLREGTDLNTFMHKIQRAVKKYVDKHEKEIDGE